MRPCCVPLTDKLQHTWGKLRHFPGNGNSLLATKAPLSFFQDPPKTEITMRAAFASVSLFLSLVSASILYPPQSQHVLQPEGKTVEFTEATINRLLAAHNDDPVEVMRLLDPVYAETLDEPRLLQVFGSEPVWMTEGDKLRLKKRGLSFMDLTGREDLARLTSSFEKQTGMSFSAFTECLPGPR